jgi:hypothetical protein
MKQKQETNSSSSSNSSSNQETTTATKNAYCLKTRSGRSVKCNTDYTERYLKKK